MGVFVELMRESVIMRGLLALIVLIAVVVMLFSNMAVPNELWALLGLAWGFFFGSAPNTAVQRAAEMASLKRQVGQ